MTVAEELSQQLANCLSEPAKLLAEGYVIDTRAEFENLRLRYLNENSYKDAIEALYNNRAAYLIKENGSFNLDLNMFLKLKIGKFIFMIRSTGGADFLETDKFRKLIKWYSDGIDVSYQVYIGKTLNDVTQDYYVVAKAKNQTQIKLDFKYLKLNNWVETAAKLWATAKVLKEIHPTAKKVPDKPKTDKPKWNAERELLIKIFKALRDEKLPSKKNAVEATDENIDTAINSTFVDKEDRPLLNQPPVSDFTKIVQNCDTKALVHLFMYLTCRKVDTQHDTEKNICYLEDESKIEKILADCFIYKKIDPDTNKKAVREFKTVLHKQKYNLNNAIKELFKPTAKDKKPRKINLIKLAIDILPADNS